METWTDRIFDDSLGISMGKGSPMDTRWITDNDMGIVMEAPSDWNTRWVPCSRRFVKFLFGKCYPTFEDFFPEGIPKGIEEGTVFEFLCNVWN